MNPGNKRHGSYVFNFDWPAAQKTFGGPLWPKLAQAYSGLNSFTDTAVDQIAGLKRNPDFTETGRKGQALGLVKGPGAAAVREARAALREGKVAVETIRSQLSLGSTDKTDIAGAVLRGEIRRHLQTMDPARRSAMLRMGEMDRATMDAILEGPAYLSGLTPEQHQSAQLSALQERNPKAVAELQAVEEAMAALESALTATKATVQEAARLAPDEVATALGEPSHADRMAEIIGDLDEPIEDAA